MSRYALLSMAALAAAQVQQGAPSLAGSSGSGVGSNPMISNPGAAGGFSGAGGAGGAGAGGLSPMGSPAGAGPAAPALKAQTALPWLLIGVDPEPIIGSVIAAPNAQATTVQIGCVPGAPAGLCNLPPSGYSVIHESQSLFRASVTVPGTYTLSYQCTVTSVAGVQIPAKASPALASLSWGNGAPNAAVCTAALTAPDTTMPASATTFTGTEFLGQILPIAITSGIEKLQAAATAAPSASAGATTSASAASSSGGAVAGGAAAGGASAGTTAPAGTTAAPSIASTTASMPGMSGGSMNGTAHGGNSSAPANSTTSGAVSNSVGSNGSLMLLASSVFVGAASLFLSVL